MTENGRALATVIKFGRVSILVPGDLTWDRERMLMCPVNKIGHINLYIVGNHGMAGATSPALVYGITPQVVIMDNGATKGGGLQRSISFVAPQQAGVMATALRRAVGR